MGSRVRQADRLRCLVRCVLRLQPSLMCNRTNQIGTCGVADGFQSHHRPSRIRDLLGKTQGHAVPQLSDKTLFARPIGVVGMTETERQVTTSLDRHLPLAPLANMVAFCCLPCQSAYSVGAVIADSDGRIL